jgi:class 3 adenylate cyclase/tetratricopeptide (TPR) repeat protein
MGDPSPDAQRRQLTVMFCDLVGSTALSGRLDPEELRELMQSYQRTCGEVIARYGGHVAQYLGDGLMVYFGWPQAYEDGAVRAIRAGLEVTEAVAHLTASTPISARVGIHTGLVVIGETGRGDASIPKAAVGETPNIAARVQGLAEPGGVVVSERTAALASGLFDYADLGAPALKGVSTPLRLFRVTRARAVESRFEASRNELALTPLVGREEEIALLLRRWEQAREGEGQVVLVSGEPGIGKSRLTRVLRERMAQQPYGVLRYQCSPYHLHSALFPVIEQFERSARFTRDDNADEKQDKMRASLVGTEEQIAQSAPLFAALLGLPAERYSALNLTPEKQKEKTLEAIAGQIEARASQQPLLMLFEDAHWIDATSRQALDLLIPRLRDLPVLLIITYRPEHSLRWTDHAHVTMLSLNRLGRRQAVDLVNKLSGGKTLPREVLDQILAHTDGVPLFVEELTKSVLESKLLRDAGDHYVLDGPLPALAIPATLRDSLIARLDRLAPMREVAQIGACIGREFSYELLAAISPLKGARLDEALEELTGTGLIFRRGTPPDATYTFKHALVQDAAYDSLLKSKRTQLHAQIAQALEQRFSGRAVTEPELLALHFTQAGLDERAVPYWISAGRHALASVALAEAVGHLTTALDVNARLPPSTQSERWELEIRVMLGTAYMAFLGWTATEIAPTLRPARDLAMRLGEHELLISILYQLSNHHAMRCEYADCVEAGDQLGALAQSSEDSVAFIVDRFAEADLQCFMGNFSKARAAGEQLLQAYVPEKHGHLVHTLNMDPRCNMLLWGGVWLWALGYPDQARQSVMDMVEFAQRLGHPFNLCWDLLGSAFALGLRGETQLALSRIAEGLKVAQEHALNYMADVMVPTHDGIALIEEGAFAEGYAKYIRHMGHWRTAGGLHLTPYGNQLCAKALIGMERFDEAKAQLTEAVEIIERTGHRMHEAEVHRVFGELWRQHTRPNVEAAETSYRKALEVARVQEAKSFELRASTSLAMLWQSQGKRREAYALLAPVYNWFTEGFDTRDLKAAKALLDELA